MQVQAVLRRLAPAVGERAGRGAALAAHARLITMLSTILGIATCCTAATHARHFSGAMCCASLFTRLYRPPLQSIVFCSSLSPFRS
jgi:hypothetical protein